MADQLQFQLPQACTLENIGAILSADCVLKAGRPVGEKLLFYDTFDWRLYRRSLALCWNGRELSIRSLPAGEKYESCPAATVPALAGQLAEGPLRQRLEPLAGILALLQMGNIHIRVTPCQVLNAEGKMVARLLWTENRVGRSTPFPAEVLLQRVRGYDGRYQELSNRLQQAGILPQEWQRLYFQAIQAAGNSPGSYTGRPDYQLDPAMRADEAVKTGLRAWLAVIRANEAGIRADLDTEFLHEFRTALRRTRSALSQIRGIFPEPAVEEFKATLGQIGQRTNRLRDLDVYLLAEAGYRQLLPEAMRDDLNPVFAYLRSQRQAAAAEVAAGLASPEYQRAVQSWEAFLNSLPDPASEPPNAGDPILGLAQRQVSRCYRRVVQHGLVILNNAQDALLHELRIDCKKLRYLMEFFASLFPGELYAAAIEHMKNLQDMLGKFCDLSIQQSALLALAEEMPLESKQARRALLATGFLVEGLARQQQASRETFAGAFKEFTSPANRRLFHQLIAGPA